MINIKKFFSNKKDITEDNKKDKYNNVSSKKVKVVIWRQLANKIPIKTDSFYAEEDRDNNNNKVIKSEEYDFKKNLEIEKEDFIEVLSNKMELMRISAKSSRVEKIQDKIKEQKELIRKIENKESIKKPKGDEYYNIWTEKNRLRQYEIFLYTIRNEDNDSVYEFINEEGLKEYNYVMIDGLFYPMFYNPTTKTFHVGVSSKQKLYKDKDTALIEEYNEDMFGGKRNWFSNIPRIAFVILFIAMLVVTSYSTKLSLEYSKSLDESSIHKVEMSALKCVDTLQSINLEVYEELKKNNEYFEKYKNQTTQEMKTKIINDVKGLVEIGK